jgi:hypothetical protein
VQRINNVTVFVFQKEWRANGHKVPPGQFIMATVSYLWSEYLPGLGPWVCRHKRASKEKEQEKAQYRR